LQEFIVLQSSVTYTVGMNSNCDICQNPPDKGTILLDTKFWTVVLAPDQGYPGRTYVTLKHHKENLSQLSKAEWDEYASLVKRLETACKQALGATLFNWSCLMNNAYQLSPPNPHVHWHFRPRYEKELTIRDVTFTDKSFGYHYDRKQKQYVDTETFSDIFERIAAHL
jgi:diadenosine tetraphosphate (Ap4A) HIT family hydrolase